jgi:glutathione S-transferase
MKLELISFKLCPFAQASVIALKKQKLNHEVNYINLMSPPDWFKKISPLGQVPLLKVDNDVIFESAVINEFINDISTTNLHPEDKLKKAKNRAWIKFSSDILDNMFQLITAKDEENFNQAKERIFSNFSHLEQVKNDDKFFNSENFSIIDASYAPIFMRLNWLEQFTNNLFSLDNYPKLKNWSDNLLADNDVINSVVEALDEVYYSSIAARESYLSSQLNEH